MKLLLLVFLIYFLELCKAFNIDINAPTYKVGPALSNFGFSVAQHFNGKKATFLIGAPKAESGQNGTIQAGAIFTCPLNSFFRTKSGNDKRWCEQAFVEYPDPTRYHQPPKPIISRDNTIDSLGQNHQLLGAVVASSGKEGGRAIACAPLKRYHEGVSYTDGSCYVLDSNLAFNSMIHTCSAGRLSKNDRHNQHGACMQGFSATIDEELILTGSIGARAWTGGVFGRYLEKSDDPFAVTVDRTTLGYEEKKNGIRDNKRFESGDYVGYSVRHGRFGFWYEDKKNFTVVSGSTRHNQTGSVVFFPFMNVQSTDIEEQLSTNDGFILSGKQIGGGFGYSIEILDLNKDGFDDLVVGAPFEFFTDAKGTELHGAVYVYFSSGKYQSRDQNHLVFNEPIILRNEHQYSQFGLSIAKMGNLDRDEFEYQDFAVGAPFAEDGMGSIYIYHGSKDEKSFKVAPAQTISASKISISPMQKPLKSFGFALSGGVDVDGNGYPDLMVGAPLSDTVVLLRSRPIINIITKHFIVNNSVSIDGGTNCPKGSKTCFDVTTTLTLNPRYAKEKLVDYRSDVFVCQLEVLSYQSTVEKRAKIANSNDDVFVKKWDCGKNLDKAEQSLTHKLYISKDNKDWLNPLKLKFSVSIKNQAKAILPRESEELVNFSKFPILNKFNSTHEVIVPFFKKCGSDDKCEADLQLTATFLNISHTDKGSYVTKVGDKDSINIKFIVKNVGERAFESKLYLKYNQDELDVPQLDTTKGLSTVNLESYENDNAVFSLGNPMEPEKTVTFHVIFKLAKSESQQISNILTFNALANSTSSEKNDKDNAWSADLELIKRAELILSGVSAPQMNYFGTSDVDSHSEIKLEEDVGPMVKHQYTITNDGPFYVRDVTIEFDWPFRLDHDDGENNYALYLLETPTIIEADKTIRRCTIDDGYDYVNPQKLITDITLSAFHSEKIKARKKRASDRPFNMPDLKIGSASFLGSKGIKPKTLTDSSGSNIQIVDLDCKDGKIICFPVKCHFAYIDAGSSSQIEFRARLWNRTFIEHYTNIEYVQISSSGRIIISPDQGIIDDLSNNFFTISTHAYPDRPKLQTQEVPLWYILIGILIGLLILGAIIFCFYKCGFFKRRRTERDAPSLYQARLQNDREQWIPLN